MTHRYKCHRLVLRGTAVEIDSVDYLGFLFAIILSIILLLVVFKAIMIAVVLITGSRYKALVKLNHQYSFKSNFPTYISHYTCDSKREFDRFDFWETFKEYLEENSTALEKSYSLVHENETRETEYLSRISNLPKSNYKFSMLNKTEERLCNRIKKEVVTDFIIKICAYYTSPKGRNSYSKSKSYHGSNYAKVMDLIEDQRKKASEHSEIVRKERAKLTPSLRYDVMKHDGFSCVLCGATKDDGVKLHVDHIVPVSKGGKTELKNLRTLCDYCNIGKSDKLP